MPTLISHLAVPLVLGAGLGARAIPQPLLLVGCVAAVLPDLDVVAFRLGIPYADAFGHRGFSHSFVLAALLGLLAATVAPVLRGGRWVTLLFVAGCAVSHGLLDMFTDAGEGIAALWPWTEERFFAPWRVIEASPLSLRRLFGPRGLEVLRSEAQWVWAPGVALAVTVFMLRKLAFESPARGRGWQE